ncbi:MAG: response regulator [Prevotella sp.]|nr:response regulator [Prevotella sp.]
MNKCRMLLLLVLHAMWTTGYSTTQIDSSNGLSNNFILSMALDGEGNVWVGTESGLNCIAGHTINVYRREQLGIANEKVMALFYDRCRNRMLVGTEMGLVTYDCQQGHFGAQLQGDALVSYSLVNMADDHRQGVWLVYGNGQIQHLDCSTNQVTTLAIQLPGSRCGMDDGQGFLYIGHNKDGVSIIDLKKGEVVRHYQEGEGPKVEGRQTLPSSNVRRIVKDSRGHIWMGTDQGLVRYDADTESFTLADNIWAAAGQRANVYDIMEMADGHLWTVNDVGGVLTDDERQVETSSKNTRCILQDAYHNVWIGNHSTGVDFIPSRKPLFQPLDLNNGKAMRVYGITSDRSDRLWVSSEDELSMLQLEGGAWKAGGRWRVGGMKHRAHSFARCLMVDSKGHVWMGMEDEGVMRFDTHRQTFESVDIGYGGCDIHSFMEDTDGRIWIGAEVGVYVYDKGHASHHDEMTQLVGKAPVTSFYRLSPTQLLLATHGSGLHIVNTTTMNAQHLTMAEGLPTNNINQALPDGAGFWLATNEGLIRLPDIQNLRQFTIYDTKAGLADREIYAIQQDAQGRVWASTYTGIVCLDTVTGRFHNYGQQHKLNASGFLEGTATTLSNGSIAFGTSKGVYYFHPDETDADVEVSAVRIVGCEVFSPTGEEDASPQYLLPDGDGHLTMTHQQNTLRIAFAVGDYAQGNDVDYSYMMKGLSDKWYPCENDREVIFRSLRPGNYTFVLRAKLRSQDWEKATTTQLGIRITPPFWQSWWAYLLYAALALAALLLLIQQYKRRIALHNSLEMTRRESQQKQELNEERLRFFTNITHELRTPLTLILGPLEDLAADQSLTAGSRRKVEMINKSAGRLRDLINQILEFRKTETQNRTLTVARGDIGQMVREIVLNYRELNRNQQVDIRYHQKSDLPVVYFDSEVIATVLNNLLSNAVKYTEQGSIDVTTEATPDNQICIHVADTGYGIAADALPHIFDRYYQAKGSHQASGTGIGLSLVKSLVDLHQAKITVQSEEGKGCEFIISLSAANTYPNALHKEDNEQEERNMKSEKTAADEGDEGAEAQQTPLLLIVEDNEDIRQYIVDSLVDDYRILQAKNGLEGTAMANEHLPDMIVSDIMMPKMNGIELTKQLKGNIQTSHIPIILLTAKDTDEDKEEGYDNGADSYLTKPFTAKLLTSRIRNLLANRRRLAEQLSNNGVESIPRNTAAKENLLGRLDREFMERLNRTIEEHIMQADIDMAFLTDKMAMSHSTFYRKVKALTGLTAKEYVRKQRLRHCYKLLQSGDYNVTEAAMMTGFNQMAHFREVFKKEFGILPSELTRKA